MTTININAHDGVHFKAYIALPGDRPAPCVIVIQEIFGINAEIRAKCDALAAQGYMAVAPDLFWRIEPGIELVDSVPEQLQRAFELFGLFDFEKGVADLKATLEFVRADQHCNGRVGCVGYCLGGKLAYRMATDTDIEASVSYYGVGLGTMLDRKKDIDKPLLLHIAEKDQFVPQAEQAQILKAFKDVPHVEAHVYEGADHAFARDGGTHYKPDAAKQANARTAEFLEKNLF